MTGVKWLRIESSGTMHITMHKWLIMTILPEKDKTKVQNNSIWRIMCIFTYKGQVNVWDGSWTMATCRCRYFSLLKPLPHCRQSICVWRLWITRCSFRAKLFVKDC